MKPYSQQLNIHNNEIFYCIHRVTTYYLVVMVVATIVSSLHAECARLDLLRCHSTSEEQCFKQFIITI